MGKQFRAHIGNRIKQVRGNTTQERFAKRIGVKQNYVCRYEKGRVPSPELLLKIAQFGNVTVDWLLTGKHGRESTQQLKSFGVGGKTALDRNIQRLLGQMGTPKKNLVLKTLRRISKKA